MAIFYSPSRLGFFDSELFPNNLPEDCLPITQEEHTRLFDGQTQGKRIVPGDGGYPTLADQLPPTADDVRLQRNFLLAETDWTQGADVPQTLKDMWAPYRQALRDIPLQQGFPTQVQWPVKPN